MRLIDITIETGARLALEVTIPAVPIVNDTDGTITPEVVLDGYIGYAKGQRIVGTLDISEAIDEAKEAGRQEVIDSQSDANSAPGDLVLGKIAYSANNNRVEGALDVSVLEQAAYNQGAADYKGSLTEATATPETVASGDKFYGNAGELLTGSAAIGWKDPLWWDIYNILNQDTTSGYIAKVACLYADEWQYITLQGADAYRMSDGTFITSAALTTTYTHTWLPSAYKPDSMGGFTKYVIRYYKSDALPSTNYLISTNYGYPIYVVTKDAIIQMGTATVNGFLYNSYILKGYDRINCKYSGTSANVLLGGAQYGLVHIPESFEFTQALTSVGSCFSSPVIQQINYGMFDWSAISNFTGIMPTQYGLEEIEGVIDCAGKTAQGSLFAATYSLRRAKVANVNFSFNISFSSVWEPESLIGFIDALVDRAGQSALIFTVGPNGRTLPTSEWDKARAKGWTVTGTFN